MFSPGIIGTRVQKAPTGGGGGSITVGTPDSKTASGFTTHNLTGLAASTKLIILTGSELSGAGGLNASVSSTPSITWTKKADCTAEGGSAEIYEGIFTAGGSINITVDWFPFQTFWQFSTVFPITGHEAVANGTATQTATAQNLPSLVVNGTKTGGRIFVVSSDYNAVDLTSVTLRSGGFQTYSTRDPAHGTGLIYYYPVNSVGSITVGWTSPSAPDPSVNTAAYEVRPA